MAEIFLSHGRQVVDILQVSATGDKQQEVDMQELFARFTLDSIAGFHHDHASLLWHSPAVHSHRACAVVRVRVRVRVCVRCRVCRVGAEIAFGKKIGSLERPVSFSVAFNTAQLICDSRFQKFWWKVPYNT
jgi:hypothetical protein